MNRRTLLAALVGGLIASSVFYFADRKTLPQIDRGEADLEAMWRQLAHIERGLERTNERLEAQVAGGPDVARESEDRPLEDPRVPSEGSAEASAQQVPPEVPLRERGRIIDQAFASEPRDPLWSESASRSLREHITGALPDSSELTSCECRVSACRFETRHRDNSSYLEFVEQAFSNGSRPLPENGRTLTVVKRDGEDFIATTFTARSGMELPGDEL